MSRLVQSSGLLVETLFGTTTRSGRETLIRYVMITFKVSETQLLFPS